MCFSFYRSSLFSDAPRFGFDRLSALDLTQCFGPDPLKCSVKRPGGTGLRLLDLIPNDAYQGCSGSREHLDGIIQDIANINASIRRR